MAARAVRPYRNRWGIEEGNKNLEQFMARTMSDDHCFWFFNMGFSIILYNVWRLVDLLVQLSLEGHTSRRYNPRNCNANASVAG
jgi:IS4 transposase